MHDEESPSEELLLHLSRTREAPATPCQKVKLQVKVEVPGSQRAAWSNSKTIGGTILEPPQGHSCSSVPAKPELKYRRHTLSSEPKLEKLVGVVQPLHLLIMEIKMTAPQQQQEERGHFLCHHHNPATTSSSLRIQAGIFFHLRLLYPRAHFLTLHFVHASPPPFRHPCSSSS